MKMSITLECDCGNKDTIILKRVINKIPDTGRVYEDYSMITESDFKDRTFAMEKSQPDDVTIVCQKCGHTQELSL